MNRNACVAAIVAVVLWQARAAANKNFVSDAGYRTAWSEMYASEGVNFSAEGAERRQLLVSTYQPDTDRCDRTLDAIAADTNFMGEITDLGFTSVACISRDENYGITSSETREIAPPKPRLSWRKEADA